MLGGLSRTIWLNNGGGKLQPFNLPMFLTIEKNITNALISKLDKEFNNISQKKIMIFTSKEIYDSFKKGIDKLIN